MLTYQDLSSLNSERERQDFVYSLIERHKTSDLYKESVIARKYYKKHNVTIEEFQKWLYTLSGKQVPDVYSANYKIKSNFLRRFITQQVYYLLGNGVSWNEESTADKLGDKFENELRDAAKESLIGGVSYGFFNLDHVEVFTAEEFAPLFDEEDGALKAGVRFWQIDGTKPLRATLYEMDGYTEYMWKDGQCEILQDKRAYINVIRSTDVDGMKIYHGENYPGFPIVPLWANDSKQSELTGNRESIDAYDLIKSGFCNDLDEVSQVFWIIQNAGGMDEVDLAKFIQEIKRTHTAMVQEDGATAEAHTIDIPHEAREKILDRLERDLYRDFMALDTERIASGAVTATQIKAAYQPLDNKTDDFEYNVIEFIQGILEVAGIEDDPTFTRSLIINRQEEITSVMNGAQYFTDEYVTRKLLTILGDADKADDMLKQMDADELKRVDLINESEEDKTEESVGEAEQENRSGTEETGAEA